MCRRRHRRRRSRRARRNASRATRRSSSASASSSGPDVAPKWLRTPERAALRVERAHDHVLGVEEQRGGRRNALRDAIRIGLARRAAAWPRGPRRRAWRAPRRARRGASRSSSAAAAVAISRSACVFVAARGRVGARLHGEHAEQLRAARRAAARRSRADRRGAGRRLRDRARRGRRRLRRARAVRRRRARRRRATTRRAAATEHAVRFRAGVAPPERRDAATRARRRVATQRGEPQRERRGFAEDRRHFGRDLGAQRALGATRGRPRRASRCARPARPALRRRRRRPRRRDRARVGWCRFSTPRTAPSCQSGMQSAAATSKRSRVDREELRVGAAADRDRAALRPDAARDAFAELHPHLRPQLGLEPDRGAHARALRRRLRAAAAIRPPRRSLRSMRRADAWRALRARAANSIAAAISSSACSTSRRGSGAAGRRRRGRRRQRARAACGVRTSTPRVDQRREARCEGRRDARRRRRRRGAGRLRARRGSSVRRRWSAAASGASSSASRRRWTPACGSKTAATSRSGWRGEQGQQLERFVGRSVHGDAPPHPSPHSSTSSSRETVRRNRSS